MTRKPILSYLFRPILLLSLVIAVMLPQRAAASVDNTYNMLLIGADRRDESWNGNSDVMILVTANYDTQQIYLTSFMRDLYANVSGYGVNKMNFAYAVGGAEKLIETLESNYGVKIDNYMAVDFVAMSNLVDKLGGVDLYIKENEISWINSWADWMCETYNLTNDSPALEGEGYHHLSGVQTVSFCRIRYVGNNDYERTERQRRVLTALREKTNALSTVELETLVLDALMSTKNDVLPLGTVEVMKVVNDSRYWDQIENRVPYDGMFTVVNEILTPIDMSATVSKLQSLIYGEDTSAAGNYSITIGNDIETIRRVQQALNEAGFDCGAVDGYMGAKTAGAIVEYQKAHGMEESGMIDTDLLEAMGIDE